MADSALRGRPGRARPISDIRIIKVVAEEADAHPSGSRARCVAAAQVAEKRKVGQGKNSGLIFASGPTYCFVSSSRAACDREHVGDDDGHWAQGTFYECAMRSGHPWNIVPSTDGYVTYRHAGVAPGEGWPRSDSRTVVPVPGWADISNEPPTRPARSSMPSKPYPA